MPARAIHLHPTAPLAPRVLLPGDPGRALQLATELLDRPIMFNHNRGLWGYTGAAADGEPLTIQSTGIGGSSAAVVTNDLCLLGMTTAIRIGTAWVGPGGPALGELITVSAARSADGPSRALGAGELLMPDAELTAALSTAAPSTAVESRDLPPDPARIPDGLVCDLSCAAVLAATGPHEVRAAAILAVAHAETGDLDVDGLRAAASALGAAAVAALGIPAREAAPLPPPREDEAA